MTNDLQPTRSGTIAALFKAKKAEIALMLPKHLTPERMLMVTHSAVSRNPALLKCTDVSLLNATIGASILGLEIGGPLGLAHLVPFKNNKTSPPSFEATLIVGYQGYMQLGYNSPLVQNIYFHAVYKNDHFDFRYGLDKNLTHKPAMGDRGPLEYAYAVVKYKNGGSDFYVVDELEAERTKKKARGSDRSDSVWKTDPPAMWKKTAVRRLAKRMPLDTMRMAANIEDAAEVGVQVMSYIPDPHAAAQAINIPARDEPTRADTEALNKEIEKISSGLTDGEYQEALHVNGCPKNMDCVQGVPVEKKEALKTYILDLLEAKKKNASDDKVIAEAEERRKTKAVARKTAADAATPKSEIDEEIAALCGSVGYPKVKSILSGMDLTTSGQVKTKTQKDVFLSRLTDADNEVSSDTEDKGRTI